MKGQRFIVGFMALALVALAPQILLAQSDVVHRASSSAP